MSALAVVVLIGLSTLIFWKANSPYCGRGGGGFRAS